ncbi:MAG: ABC transporter ATP-binding protein [Deltaproteobacteria bacterium]|nr:ABC transporter ATP-binding protein [Deltaproteobacteria bacterium]
MTVALVRTEALPAHDPTLHAAWLNGVSRDYGDGARKQAVLRGINLMLEKGALHVILGASGSGKTTLLNIIGGLDRPSNGEVIVDGLSLHALPSRELVTFRQSRTGFIFQFYNLMPTLTSLENVEVALEHAGLKKGERRERAVEMLRAVGLVEHLGKFPGELSGGEQQRVAIARALVRKPALLLCDEPTGNLDAESGRIVVELIDRLRKECGSTAIVVTHNPELFPHADRVVRIKNGVSEPS